MDWRDRPRNRRIIDASLSVVIPVVGMLFVVFVAITMAVIVIVTLPLHVILWATRHRGFIYRDERNRLNFAVDESSFDLR